MKLKPDLVAAELLARIASAIRQLRSSARIPHGRQRRHRARRRRGSFVVPVEVTGEMVEALVDRGDVDDANSSDLDCVGKAITAAARRGLELT